MYGKNLPSAFLGILAKYIWKKLEERLFVLTSKSLHFLMQLVNQRIQANCIFFEVFCFWNAGYQTFKQVINNCMHVELSSRDTP